MQTATVRHWHYAVVLLAILLVVGFAPLALRPSSFVLNKMKIFLANVELVRPDPKLAQAPRTKQGRVGSAWTPRRNGSEQECQTYAYRKLLILSWVQPNYSPRLYFTPDFLGRQRFPQLRCPETCVCSLTQPTTDACSARQTSSSSTS